MHFCGQFKNHNSVRKHGNQTNDPIFPFIFFAATICYIHIFYLKIVKAHFHVVPFGLFWSVIYLDFEQKLPIRRACDTSLEIRQPEVTKNPCYVSSPKKSQKQVSAHRLIAGCRGVYIHYFKISQPPSSLPYPPPNFLQSPLS